MSINIPAPTPYAPYPVVNDALNLARARVNDAIQSIGGEIFVNTQPYTQVMTNGAWLRMQKYMASLGYSRNRKRTVLSGFPPVNSQDPASECRLNWSTFFDGVSYWIPPNVPVLPQDLINPIELRQRRSYGYQPVLTQGTTGFSRIPLISTGENSNFSKNGCNGWWDWRYDEVVLSGSNMSFDLEVYYLAAFPSFATVGQVQWYLQPIPIVQSESALAYYICHEFTVGRADPDAQSWLALAQQECRDLINTSEVPLRQRFNVSRRSYAGNRTGGGSFGYGGF